MATCNTCGGSGQIWVQVRSPKEEPGHWELAMSTATAAGRDPVCFPDLAQELGLTRMQRSEILRERLLTPVESPVRRGGSPVWISPESADYLTEAKHIVDKIKNDPDTRKLAVGITVIVVLRLLLSGSVRPSLF